MCRNSNISFQASFYDKFLKIVPNKDLKNSVKYNKTGQLIASPHWNRVALGVSAMATQPWFDYLNPNVDKDTARTSCCRTFAKIIVCTTIGFLIRGGVFKLTNKYMNATKKEGSTLLTPNAILNETNKEVRNMKLKIHKNAFSTITALGVMLFTNVLLDAPLTTKFSNFLISKMQHKEKNK